MSASDDRIQADVPQPRDTRIQTASTPELPPNWFGKLSVIVPGLFVGTACAACYAAFMTPAAWTTTNRISTWIMIMGGPLFAPGMCFGWPALFLIPAHPARPNGVTAVLTILGLALWFFAGYLTYVGLTFGA